MQQFPMPPAGYVTYAIFSLPHSMPGATQIKFARVDARDFTTLDIPPKAFKLYFSDIPKQPRNPDDPFADEINPGADIYIAREIISADELRNRLLAEGVLKSLGTIPVTRDADGKITDDVLRHTTWLSKSNSAAWHAVGRNGEYLQIRAGQGITVIDENKNVMMAPHETEPRAFTSAPPAPPPPVLRVKKPRDSRFKL